MTRIWVCLISFLTIAALAQRTAVAGFAVTIDGQFTPGGEWIGAPSQNFALDTNPPAGGARLYGDVVGSTVYFMIDYYTHQAAPGFSSRFDVLFTSANGLKDYLVQIYQGTNVGGANIQTFEKDANVVVTDNPFVVTDGVWVQDSIASTAGLIGKVNIGGSPDNHDNHVMAEFEISKSFLAQVGTFLSVSELDYTPFVMYDPPLASVTIDLTGTQPLLAPVLGPNGDPVPQPQEAAPEAASWVIWTMPMIGLVLFSGVRSLRRRMTLAA